MKSNNSEYFSQLDSLRAIAVLMVIISHWFSNEHFLNRYTANGVIGVTLFFVLSGFLPRVFRLIRIPDFYASGKSIFLNPFSWFYEHICKNVSSDLRIGSLLYAVILIFFYWSICYILDKKKIYIKV